jgi:hypothetical protein
MSADYPFPQWQAPRPNPQIQSIFDYVAQEALLIQKETTSNHTSMTTKDKQTIKEIAVNITTQFNKQLKKVVEALNKNEEILDEKIETTLAQFEERYNDKIASHDKTLDELRGNIENRLEELIKTSPRPSIIEPQKLVIKIIEASGKEAEVTLNAQHRKFPDLVLDLKAGHNIYNYGPTGSGKTVAIFTAGDVLQLPVYAETVNRETSPYTFTGYMKGGEYQPGLFYKPYTEGGIVLIDEVDNGNANAMTTIKKYADNPEAMFGTTRHKRHKDFRLVCNANTIGNGANQSYVGRNQQDKAFLNIFKFHHWDYDEDFEYTICWKEYLDSGGDAKSKIHFDTFLKSIRDFRRAIGELGILHILSPRNLKQASKDYALGREARHIQETIILKGLDDGQVEKIIAKIQSYYPGKTKQAKLDNVWGL